MSHTKMNANNNIERFYEGRMEGLEIAKEAVRDLQEKENNFILPPGTGKVDWHGRNGGIKTLGIGISTEFIQKGFIDLRGKEVQSPEQLAILAQVYRDPRYETLRLIYMKGNTIAGHEGITSRLPNSSAAFMNVPDREKCNSDEEYMTKSRHAQLRYFMSILNRMERMKADGYFILHNHPSAISIDPSKEDIYLTVIYKSTLSGFRGHIIIDSNKYCFIDKDIDYIRYPLFLGDDSLTKPSIPHPLLGKLVSSPDKLAALGKTMQIDTNYSIVIYVNAKQYIRAIQEIPDGLFKREKECVDYLRGRMRDFGASKAFLVSPNESICEIASDMVRKGYLLDAIVTDNNKSVNSVRENGIDSPRDSIFNRWMGIYADKGFRVNERERKYADTPVKQIIKQNGPGLTI